MTTAKNWMELLDQIIALREDGPEFDRLHTELSMKAASVDFNFLTLVMSGEFESARKYLRSIDWKEDVVD
jgi:hypothetical protein